MKKITIIASHLNYGGIEQAISNVTNLLKDDYEIDIIALYKVNKKPVYEIDKKIKITYLIDSTLPLDFKLNGTKYYIKNMKFLTIIKAIYIKKILRNKMLKKCIKKCKSDIVMTTHLFMNKNIKKFKGYKVCWEHNHHDNDPKIIGEFLKNSKYVDEMIVVSGNIEKFYNTLFKEENIKTKITSIPNFINIDTQKYTAYNKKNILAVGRLEKEKGYLDLIDVMDIVAKKDNDIKLNLCGDGSEYNIIKNKIKKLGLEKNVVLHGFLSRNDLNKLSLESSLFTMSSYKESFGLVLLEAMVYKIPCIAFDDAKGACELIKNNYNGYLINNRNKTKMASKIIELLNDKEKLINLGENALEMSKLFSKEKNKIYWTNFIERVTNE